MSAGDRRRLTGSDNCFEDFEAGAVYEHARSKTVTEMDGVLLTNLVLNTAAGHFDEEAMKQTPFGSRIVFGGITASLVIGLAAEDTAEQAVAELGLDGVRFLSPVRHGDTLTAYTEVLETREAGRSDAGEVRFRHFGANQKGELVFVGERRVLLRKRGAP